MARRARATSRWRRSSNAARRTLGSSRGGKSTISRSTVRAERRAPARDRPSANVPGVRTTSHSSLIPRATASTGSNDRGRSSHATMEPAAWTSAASRRARVVRPLEASPRTVTLADRGRPPGPRMASSAGNPVETTSRAGPTSRAETASRAGPMSRAGADTCAGTCPGVGVGADPGTGAGLAADASASSGSGTVASAPTVSPNRRGAAAPQRAWRVASAAVMSGGRTLIGPPIIEQMF